MPISPGDNIASRTELAAFVRALREDYLTRGHEWENDNLDDYLESLAAWIDAADGWHRNAGKEAPAGGDWTFMARALQAATVYE
ncbi:DUF7660 family protein [Yinghuangia seranimata]|uniref:DUF7660 family protein n=1 Tax=Yinghuangia seranimata TaxID=408067 RepID=UPI00248A9379|nr:hypothetical protein [Yinghuangia seranimata]MDI2124935.1 hypothetical protein [Yinghuangia seranimata]